MAGTRIALAVVDRYLLPTGRSAANPPAAAAAVDRWDGRTDGRTVGCSTVSSTAVRVLSGPCQQVCVEPPLTSVLNMTLPAAAARAPAAIDRYLLPATELSSPRRCCCRSTGQTTDGRTDTRPLHRRCTAFCANSVKKV